MEVGDVYSVEIPSSDGHEQAGARPAIIAQAPQFGDRLPTVLIVPLTSRLTAQSFTGTFLIQPDSEVIVEADQFISNGRGCYEPIQFHHRG